jgi:HYDIN/CFA65/VesB family protein
MKTASRIAATLVFVLLGSTSRAALVDVGNGLINHPTANLTWVADANLFQTMLTADSTLVSKVVAAWTDGPIPTLAGDGTTHTIAAADFNAATGRMNWYGARAWANYLRVTHYKGYSDWRLPELGTASLQTDGCLICVPGDGGFAVNSSEWWRLFFEELGGTAHVPISTSNNGSYALFQNIEGESFWGNARNGTTAALFRDRGEQIRDLTSVVGYRVWAVRAGQSVANPPLAPYISFTPENPIFAVTPYDTPTTGTVTLRNFGTAAATIASITGSGDFAVTHNCGTSLAMNATCLVNVTFRPTELLARTGTLTVNAEAVFTTTMSGTGGIAASISASPDTVKEGKSVTLTWNSSPHAVCEGVGGTPGWAGPLMQSGSRDVTSEDAGTFEYAISCTHDAQTLPAVQAVARVYFLNVASGALDWSLLLALTFALGLVLRARRRHDPAE